MNILAQSVDDVTKIATGNYTTTGILLLLLVAAGLGLWRFSTWAAKWIEMVVTRVVTHLDVVDATMRSISGTLDSQGELLAQVANKVDLVSKRVDELDRHIVQRKDSQ